jgi:hypothetical protein
LAFVFAEGHVTAQVRAILGCPPVIPHDLQKLSIGELLVMGAAGVVADFSMRGIVFEVDPYALDG